MLRQPKIMPSKAKLKGKELISWKYQYIKDYLRCIRSVDDSVGELENAFSPIISMKILYLSTLVIKASI